MGNAELQNQGNEQNNKPSKHRRKIIVAIVTALLVLLGTIVGILCFFGTKRDSQENVIVCENDDVVYHPNVEEIAFDENENIAYFNDLLIVYLFSDLDKEEADTIASKVDGRIVGDISGAINVLQIQVEECSLEELEQKADILTKLDNVLYAGYDYPIELTSENSWNGNSKKSEIDLGNEESPNGNDWWAEAIGAYSAWSDTSPKENITVGIIDDGFDTNHKDLQNKIIFLDDYSENSESDHGTHVAGLVAANNNKIGIRGVADAAELICVDWSPVTNNEESADYVSYISGGEYIEITKQLINNNVRVINNSWGTSICSKEGYIQKLYEENDDRKFLIEYFAVQATGSYEAYLSYKDTYSKRTALDSMLMIVQLLLSNKGDFLIIQSAGNGYDGGGDGLDVSRTGFYRAISNDIFELLSEKTRQQLSECNITYNSIDEHIIVVGAVKNERDSDGNYLMTTFSNYGNNVDICAPGEDVYSTVCNNKYDKLPGTSMAAPIVAGSAALLWSYNMDLSASEVRSLLLDNSVVSANGVGDGSGRNYPMLNIGNSLQQLKNSLNEETLQDESDDEITGLLTYAEVSNYLNDFKLMYSHFGGKYSSETGDHENWVILENMQYGNYMESTSVDELIFHGGNYSLFGFYLGMTKDEAQQNADSHDYILITSKEKYQEYAKNGLNISFHYEDGLISLISFYREYGIEENNIATSPEEHTQVFSEEEIYNKLVAHYAKGHRIVLVMK